MAAGNPAVSPSPDPPAGRFLVDDRSEGDAPPGLLTLRAQVFRGGRSDGDRFDASFRHLSILSVPDGRVVAGLRYRVSDGPGAAAGYAAGYYDLEGLFAGPDRVVEIGRVCVAPEAGAPDVLRLIFACLTRITLAARAGILFGCASFPGADPSRHAGALRWLRAQAAAPAALDPAAREPARVPEVRPTPLGLPPLLRAYLAMGAVVGSDAVLDADLNTLHVFAALDVRAVRPERARTLRRLAALL